MPSSDESSSASASSSSSRSPSPAANPIVAGSSSLAGSQRLNDGNTRNTAHYVAPTGYEACDLVEGKNSNAIIYEELKNSVDSGSGRQIWLFKLPEGVDASRLHGTTLQLDSSSSKVGSLKITRQEIATGVKLRDHYSIVSAASSKKSLSADGRNAKAGESAAKARKEGEKSQLVDLEDENLATDAQAAIGAHMTNLHVYLPSTRSSSKKKGTVVASPIPIARRFEVLLDPKAPIASTSASAGVSESSSAQISGPLQADPSEYRRRGQRMRKLQGYFAPSGSLYDADKANGQTLSSSAVAVEGDKSAKKRKKADVSTEEAEGDHSASSLAPDSGKKKKVKKEDTIQEASIGSKTSDASKKESKEAKKERKRKKEVEAK